MGSCLTDVTREYRSGASFVKVPLEMRTERPRNSLRGLLIRW
jgi:hypothetical protein